MLSHEAELEFIKISGYPLGSREVEEFRIALNDEITFISSVEKRTKLSTKTSVACDRIKDWYRHAKEYHWVDIKKPQSIRSFIISHRRSCVWAVLLGMEKKEGQ